jgi:1-acyl-sn-glycerol-3-phosphate acyltransferase
MISVQNQVTNSVKALVRFALWCYFKRIVLIGFSKENHAKSVIYLGNHQNALIDALLIATTTRRKTTFLTRSDVFKNPFVGNFLKYIGMLPIYRFRDGVDTLSKNTPIFNRCGEVLHDHEAILIFPEGNHGLKRRLRPLKKGFVSLLSHRWSIDKQPVYLSPIGVNYIKAVRFPDAASIVYGDSLKIEPFEISQENTYSLLAELHGKLSVLTTHIPESLEVYYDQIETCLEKDAQLFLNPYKANDLIAQFEKNLHSNKSGVAANGELLKGNSAKKKSLFKKACSVIFKFLFEGLNMVPLAVWRLFLKPGIKQPEFVSTARFGFSLFFFPCYFLLMFTLIAVFTKNIGMALAIPMIHFMLNIIFVKKIL